MGKEKEIGKLLELLNIRAYGEHTELYKRDEELLEINLLDVISKRFGFIQRLVEQDKIDLDACEGEKTYNNLTASRDSNYSQYERLLMALAIQDEPIRFLCEILK